MANKTLHNKKALIEALEKSLGIVSTACNQVGVSRTTFYEYYKTDDDFREQVDATAETALDYVESKLFKRIDKGSDAATIFYLKTKGKKRGYVERVETKDVTNEYLEMSPEEQQKEIERAVNNLKKYTKVK